LIDGDSNVELITKPYQSFLNKTFRKNIVDNKNYPVEPEGGWWLPNTCFDRMTDIIRTTIVVKYLDGVPFLLDKIDKLALDSGLQLKKNLVARDSGYYAAHILFPVEGTFYDANFIPNKMNFFCEIQISTIIKQVIKNLLHEFYVSERILEDKLTEEEKWDYSRAGFVATHLGHLFHLAESMIVECRSKMLEPKT
jgi:ppGpp synthetase/RelA/SpoT-type nucleotidyltranferase